MSKIHKSNNVKQNLLMNSLHLFFKNKENLNTIMPIIKGQSKISLRVMDWFVTNYSKKNNISYLINKNGQIINSIDDEAGKEFVVYLDYKLQLKGYQKKQFDPFCRRSRINFYYDDNKFVVTTVGQLNFFRWTIQNSVLEYISTHLEEIENDMNTCYKAVYNINKSDTKSKRRKRQELSISATKKLNKSNVKIFVSFD
tara:strand:- start:268 stop:861 length:594 start_codon:yes stop_codon:yes gene_type:complete